MTRRRAIHLAATFLVLGSASAMARLGEAFDTTPPPRLAPGAPVRILVYHDMEGLAGQDDWRTFLFSHPEKYPEGQKMLAAEWLKDYVGPSFNFYLLGIVALILGIGVVASIVVTRREERTAVPTE